MRLSPRVVFLASVLAGLLTNFALSPQRLNAATSDLYFSSTYVFAEPWFSVKRFDGITGDPVGTAGTFAADDELSFPRGLTFGPDGNLYVASEGTNNILKYDGASGMFLGEFVAAGAGGLMSPNGIAFGPDGNLYVASNGSPITVLKFNGSSGAFLANLTATLPGDVVFAPPAWGLTIGPDGMLYASSGAYGAVTRFNPVSEMAIDTFATDDEFDNPRGLTFGPDGHLYVAGGDINGRVWKFHGTTGALLGLFVSTLDNGGMQRPDGVAFGPDGNLYVSSGDTGKVLVFAGSDGHFLDVFAELEYPLGLGPAGLVFHPLTTCACCGCGDYNHDGKVDAADYVVWRKDPTSHGGTPDGYNTWRANFGNPASGSGSGSLANGVPEPSTAMLLILTTLGLRLGRRRSAQRVSKLINA